MAKDSNGTAQELLCTKCGERPRGKAHDWCNECKAELQKRYTKDRDDLLERRGFVAGVKALRAELVQRFLQVGSGLYMGHEAAAIIKAFELRPPSQPLSSEASTDNAAPL
jgi:hypothetical protein